MVLIVPATVVHSPCNVLAYDHSLAVVTLDAVSVLRWWPRLCHRLSFAALFVWACPPRIQIGPHLLWCRRDCARTAIMPQGWGSSFTI